MKRYTVICRKQLKHSLLTLVNAAAWDNICSPSPATASSFPSLSSNAYTHQPSNYFHVVIERDIYSFYVSYEIFSARPRGWMNNSCQRKCPPPHLSPPPIFFITPIPTVAASLSLPLSLDASFETILRGSIWWLRLRHVQRALDPTSKRRYLSLGNESWVITSVHLLHHRNFALLDASNTSPADLSLTARRFEVDLLEICGDWPWKAGALFPISFSLVSRLPARLQEGIILFGVFAPRPVSCKLYTYTCKRLLRWASSVCTCVCVCVRARARVCVCVCVCVCVYVCPHHSWLNRSACCKPTLATYYGIWVFFLAE